MTTNPFLAASSPSESTLFTITILLLFLLIVIAIIIIKGEHLGWYGGLATALMERGLLVVGHDHQVKMRVVLKKQLLPPKKTEN